MKRKISFVAVGQAAGNIGQLLEQQGYLVLYVNTSEEDLDTLEKAKFKYHIPKGEGCNKDRRKAKQLVVDDFDNIVGEIDSKVKADLIFVIFSSGGGTGSGAGPMLIDLLIDEGKNVGAVTIIPAPDESPKSHINSYECFTELTAINGTAACFIIDNERGEKLALNQDFAECFSAFLDIPEKYKSIKGNIDKAEVMETLQAHGMALIVRSSGKESADIIHAVKGSIFAPMESDRVVKYIASAMAGSVRMADLEKAFGTPIDNYQTFNNEETVCCISGLSYPVSRLDTVYEKISGNKELIKNNLVATQKTGLKKDVNFLEEMEPIKKKAEVKKPQSRRDVMSKYL